MSAGLGPRPKTPQEICQHDPCWCGRPPRQHPFAPWTQEGQDAFLRRNDKPAATQGDDSANPIQVDHDPH